VYRHRWWPAGLNRWATTVAAWPGGRISHLDYEQQVTPWGSVMTVAASSRVPVVAAVL